MTLEGHENAEVRGSRDALAVKSADAALPEVLS